MAPRNTGPGLVPGNPWALPRTFGVGNQSSSKQFMTGVGRVIAAVCVCRGATTAFIAQFRDGVDVTGMLLFTLGAPAGGGMSVACGPEGIPFKYGLYMNYIQGAGDVAVTWQPQSAPFE